jgi:acetylornithine/N-succinyldiaminopimelate aminotransferase
VFFSNSGAEANEAAITVARRYAKQHKGEQAVEIVAAEGGFHGRTLATLAATGKPHLHPTFAPLPAGFTHVPYGDTDALAAAVGSDTAAVLLEPVQGEAGIRLPPPGYLRAAREIASRHGALLILDEVQSGMGRTGRLFAHQHAQVRPDVITLAKALGNGYPIGATIATAEVADVMRPGDHASTFGGGPVACAAALATLDVVEPLLEGHVDKVSARLKGGLEELASRAGSGAEVRGLGLWFALDLPSGPGAKEVAAVALDRGLVVNPVTDTAVRLAPPLVVEEDEVDEALARLGGALAEVGR